MKIVGEKFSHKIALFTFTNNLANLLCDLIARLTQSLCGLACLQKDKENREEVARGRGQGERCSAVARAPIAVVGGGQDPK
jgi:hypothetical protein